MKAWARLLLTVMTGAICAQCGPTAPSESLTGTWSARGAGRSLFYAMSLQQTGNAITGVACGLSDGILMFRNALSPAIIQTCASRSAAKPRARAVLT